MGKGVTPELETSWGQKDSSTFRVDIDKLLDVAKFLDKRKEWGRFEGGIPYSFETTGAYVTKVVLKPWYVLEMPEWGGYKAAAKACQEAWDAMWKKLQEHEDGHKEVFMDILAKTEKYVEKASNLTDKQLKADMKKLVGSIQSAQDKFDTATGHGKKKGVYLDIPVECN